MATVVFWMNFLGAPADAATFNVRNATQLRNAIRNAANNGTGGDRINIRASFTTGNVSITSPVVINGRNQTLTNNGIALFFVRSNRVRINSLRIRNSGPSGNTSGIWIKAPNGTTIADCDIRGVGNGIFALGHVPKNCVIVRNTFRNIGILAIGFHRDSGTHASISPADVPDNNPFSGGSLRIEDNNISGCEIGVSIDHGNDGREFSGGRVRFNAPTYQGSRRSRELTSYTAGQAAIVNNVIAEARLFGIALAKTNQMYIANNTVSLANTDQFSNFGAAIHLEHRTQGVTVRNNNLTVARNNHRGINLTSFSDHGSTARFNERVRSIRIEDNTVSGSAGASVGGGAYSGVEILDNDFRARRSFFTTERVPGGTSSFSINRNNRGAPGRVVPSP